MSQKDDLNCAVRPNRKGSRGAEKWLKARRRKIREIRKIPESDLNKQQRARHFVIIAAGVARRIDRDDNCRAAFERLVAKKKNPKRFRVKKGASPHLPVVRFLGLGKHSAPARRHADGIDACLRHGGNWKKLRKFVRQHGVAELCRKVRGAR
jgi:hypothetical protein